MAVTRYLMKLLVLMLIAVALRLPSNMVKGDEVHGFPLVPGLRHVCGRHITGVSGQPARRTEITGEAFATDAAGGENGERARGNRCAVSTQARRGRHGGRRAWSDVAFSRRHNQAQASAGGVGVDEGRSV